MDRSKHHVLLVEDIKIAQKVASLRLMELNCEVDTAETGARAIELVNQHTYDLILMDLGLPDMDGLTVTETIRKMEKTDEHVPIIALTAHEAEDIKESCLKVGMDDFLGKPLTIEKARSVIDKFLSFYPTGKDNS